ncbi:hypothetical protein C7459_115152 [Tumebacillus permanentifrigoris]|uniref:Uncharacterized protein n=1 Tax=Tumebacillus permanentifrigoris TaxID=378543 RepID=A0A316D7A4_9BACL|nr:hypothetical protein C7459_115152 [Tumebacillus permanentifrigoris]
MRGVHGGLGIRLKFRLLILIGEPVLYLALMVFRSTLNFLSSLLRFLLRQQIEQAVHLLQHITHGLLVKPHFFYC